MTILPSNALARCAAVLATATLLTAGLVLPAEATTASPPPTAPAPASSTPSAPETSAPSPSASGTTSAPAAPLPTEQPTGQVDQPAPEIVVPTPATLSPGNPGAAAEPSPTVVAKAEGLPYAPFGAIGAKWQLLGGASGVLGDPTSNESCDASGLCLETFTGGEIYYTPGSGANAVTFLSGKSGPEWQSRGGLAALGYPLTEEKCDVSGCVQRFSQGTDLVWSTVGGYQQVWTYGAIGNAVYRLYGGYAGAGYPTSAELCTLKDRGCFQDFGQLRIEWSASSGAYGIWTPGAIGSLYKNNGAEAGTLGFPTSKETCGLKGSGCYQNYQNGAIVWSPATGPHVSRGEIRKDWASRGYENGGLGYPVTEEICDTPGAGCRQEYQGGTILWSSGTGAHSVNGGIKGRYLDQGGVSGYMGYPIENEVCNQPKGGCYQWFQGGLIFWSPTTGAQPIRGGMKTKYASMGWHLSYLGYPATPETCTGGQCIQTFQGGYLSWTPSASKDYARSEGSAH